MGSGVFPDEGFESIVSALGSPGEVLDALYGYVNAPAPDTELDLITLCCILKSVDAREEDPVMGTP